MEFFNRTVERVVAFWRNRLFRKFQELFLIWSKVSDALLLFNCLCASWHEARQEFHSILTRGEKFFHDNIKDEEKLVYNTNFLDNNEKFHEQLQRNESFVFEFFFLATRGNTHEVVCHHDGNWIKLIPIWLKA